MKADFKVLLSGHQLSQEGWLDDHLQKIVSNSEHSSKESYQPEWRGSHVTLLTKAMPGEQILDDNDCMEVAKLESIQQVIEELVNTLPCMLLSKQ